MPTTNSTKGTAIPVRPTPQMRRQLDELSEWGNGNPTEVIRTAVDRMYQQEQTKRRQAMSEATYRTRYETREDAEADGWVKNPPADWTKKDTSGYNSFGYEFTATSPDGTRQAVTTGLWIRNATNRMGKPGAIVNFYRVEDFA